MLFNWFFGDIILVCLSSIAMLLMPPVCLSTTPSVREILQLENIIVAEFCENDLCNSFLISSIVLKKRRIFMYNCNIRKWSCDLRSKVTKSENHRPNGISPAVTAVVVETQFSQAGQIAKAKNFLEKSNFARKSVVLTFLAHCNHWAFPWKFLQELQKRTAWTSQPLHQ